MNIPPRVFFAFLNSRLCSLRVPLRHFTQHLSWQQIPSGIEPCFKTVFDMASGVIKQLKPSQLSSPLIIGAGFADWPYEAKYEDALYRGHFIATRGGVCITPEFSSAPGARLGHVDFVVPAKKWGIEIILHGRSLGEHGSRFGEL